MKVSSPKFMPRSRVSDGVLKASMNAFTSVVVAYSVFIIILHFYHGSCLHMFTLKT